MLSTLDTLIAFAVIMTVLSLLITIVVQMVSAAFSLRGKNLANALSLTFQTIDPNIGEHGHSLAAQILRDPIFSDSIWRTKNRLPVPKINEATKLLIEGERRLKQAENALARNRDEFARQGLEQMVSDAEKTVNDAKPGATVPAVVANRKKQWGFWTWPWPFGSATELGNAIRPGEIYRLLHEFDDLTETEAAFRDIPPGIVKTAGNLVAALRRADHPAVESQGKLQVIAKVSEFFTSDGQRQAMVDSLANFGATVERATTQAYDRFQRWFGSAQDRAEQWFQTHMRIVTLVMAILAAFLLQLDTIEIFHQLRDRPGLVDALVKSAPGLVEKGGKILDPADTSAHEAYLLWLPKHASFELKPLPADSTAEGYHAALQALLKEKSVTSEETKTWLDEYDALAAKGTEEFLKGRQRSFGSLKEDITKAGFELVPTPSFRRWHDPHRAHGFWPQLWPHLFGVLATAGFLTLGAPFWFNLLKNLMNLRPAVANLIEKRPTSAPALPQSPDKPPSPS